MSEVCLIGNYGIEKNVSDGGRVKVRLFYKYIKDLGHEVYLVELDGWKKHLFHVFKEIKIGIKKCDVILIMAGPIGARKIIPIINILNKKLNKRVVYCPLGTGTVQNLTKKLTPEQLVSFINCENFFNIKDKKIGKHLHKLSMVAPENEALYNLYKKFYNLSNLSIIKNYRSGKIYKDKKYESNDSFRIVYLSRVNKEKGIFDLINVVNGLNNGKYNISLDIYGPINLNENEKAYFYQQMNSRISYKGVCKTSESVDIISRYNLFCLPTTYNGEGTPGALIESFFAGTPALISSFSQSKYLIKDNVNGFIFNINSVQDLKDKILYIMNNEDLLNKISLSAISEAFTYTFEYNKEKFEEVIFGYESGKRI